MNEGEKIVDGRRGVYGDPTESYERVAKVWAGILGFEIQPWQVPLCMAGLKLVRTGITPDYSDNSNDVDGFMAIFREIIGPDMIDAKLVSEYLEKKSEHKATFLEERGSDVPVDTYSHAGSDIVCEWDTGLQVWVNYRGPLTDVRTICPLRHP